MCRGDTVRMINDEQAARALQKSHGGWNSQMKNVGTHAQSASEISQLITKSCPRSMDIIIIIIVIVIIVIILLNRGSRSGRPRYHAHTR